AAFRRLDRTDAVAEAPPAAGGGDDRAAALLQGRLPIGSAGGGMGGGCRLQLGRNHLLEYRQDALDVVRRVGGGNAAAQQADTAGRAWRQRDVDVDAALQQRVPHGERRRL